MHQSMLPLLWQPCTHFCNRPCMHVCSSMTMDTLGTSMESSSTRLRQAAHLGGTTDAGDDFSMSDVTVGISCSEACARVTDLCNDCSLGLHHRGPP